MRAVVMSDSHRDEATLRMLLERVWSFCGKIDLYVHLGDGNDDFQHLASTLWARDELAGRIGVRGNCDFLCNEPYTVQTDFGQNRLLLTHGHLYGVKQGVDRLAYAAEEAGCSAALFGHTHRPFCEEVDGILLLNPGAAHDGNIAVMEESRTGKLTTKLYHFE